MKTVCLNTLYQYLFGLKVFSLYILNKFLIAAQEMCTNDTILIMAENTSCMELKVQIAWRKDQSGFSL